MKQKLKEKLKVIYRLEVARPIILKESKRLKMGDVCGSISYFTKLKLFSYRFTQTCCETTYEFLTRFELKF